MDKIRIAMADDHSMVREATCRALSQYPDFEIVGQASDGEQAIELVKQVQPDVILLDMRMPALDGIQVLLRLREVSPATKSLVLSAYEDEEYVLESVKAGAHGYLLKTIDLNELAQSIRTVHFGQTVFHPAAMARIVSLRSGKPAVPGGRQRLSRREREVLTLVQRGLDNETIAGRLDISVRTVEGHLSHIYTKLGVSSRADAIGLASSNNPPAAEVEQ